MELDDLKTAWAAQGALLERSLAIDERLLRDVVERRARSSLAPYVLWRALEVALGVGMTCALMPVLAAHAGEPRYVVAGGAAALFVVATTALSAALLARVLRLELGGPVTTAQREVERLQRAEYRALTWVVLGGVVVWLPGLLIALEALTGVDALARVDRAWLVANLAFGLVVLALGRALSRRFVERDDLAPWAGRLVAALSGSGLRAASEHLAELARFVREEPRQTAG